MPRHKIPILMAILALATLTAGATDLPPATQTDADPMTPYAVDFYFPRLANGAPAIKLTQKQFSFQFQIPEPQEATEMFIRPQRVTINFDLTKMLVDGKLIY